MNNSWFFDANFNGVPDDFFDDAIKYFDFPMEDVEPNDDAEDWDAKFRDLEPPPSNVLAGFSSGVSTKNGNTTISHDESSQLKQWPGTAETSSSRSIPLHYESSEGKYPHQFRSSSPVSVLESSGSSCSAENPTAFQPKFGIPTKRPRSKRPRPPRRTFPFISTSFVSPKFHPLVASESDSEAYLDEKMSEEQAKRRPKKKRNLTLLSCTVEVKQPSSDPPAEARRCAHCQVTKTPQWREGPMGPKTLCNACGVRYRSGRLLPEYRPAASPTFVPTIHSNSHRKVLEMRKKEKLDTTMDPTDTSVPTAPSVPMDPSVPAAPSALSGPTPPSVPIAPTVPTAPSLPTAPAC